MLCSAASNFANLQSKHEFIEKSATYAIARRHYSSSANLQSAALCCSAQQCKFAKCYAVLRCAVSCGLLCCAALCLVVCCAALGCAVVLCCAVLCCAVLPCGRAAAAAACSYLMFMKRAKQQICKHARKLRVLQLQLRACARQFCNCKAIDIAKFASMRAATACIYICSCVHACTCAIANQMCNEANVHASRFANLKLAGVAIAYACSASARMQQKQACTCASQICKQIAHNCKPICKSCNCRCCSACKLRIP